MRKRGNWIVLGLIMVLALLVGGYRTNTTHAYTEDILPPTAPLGLQATYDGTGVQLDWLSSQPGTYPLKQYRLLKQSDSSFEELAVIDGAEVTFTDSAGVPGDHYKMVAEDNQTPATTSVETAVVEAVTAPEPDTSSQLAVATGAIIEPTAGTPPQSVSLQSSAELATQIGQLEIDEHDSLSSVQADELLQVGDTRAAQFTQALATNHIDLIPLVLQQYIFEKQLLYKNFDKLNPTQQQKAQIDCAGQTDSLETDMLNLPDQYQMHAIEALASCKLLTGDFGG